ncbi:MAG: hypothetical protein KC621_30860, partial [Myxococcales bacterium]|nr:hypothetical protein [Myxococcales bacterium]
MRERGERGDLRYWRIRTRDTRRTVRSLWATRETVEATISELHRHGVPDSSRRTAPGGVRTVGDLLHRWLEAQRVRHKANEIADRTLLNYEHGVRTWLSALEDVIISELTRELVEDTLRSWRADGVAPRTARS